MQNIKLNRVQQVMSELIQLADNKSYAKTLDIFVQINISREYGYYTKLVKVNPYTVTIKHLIDEGLGGENIFSTRILDYRNFEVTIEGTNVKPITVLSEVYRFIKENKEILKKEHIIYLENNHPSNIDNRIYKVKRTYDGISYRVEVEHPEVLRELPAKDYVIKILPYTVNMRVSHEEAYEDDPGCGLYFRTWNEV